MGRFMYQHFGEAVPRHIEKEYNIQYILTISFIFQNINAIYLNL